MWVKWSGGRGEVGLFAVVEPVDGRWAEFCWLRARVEWAGEKAGKTRLLGKRGGGAKGARERSACEFW